MPPSPLHAVPEPGTDASDAGDAPLWDALPGMLLLLSRDGSLRRMNRAFAAYADLPEGVRGRGWMARLVDGSVVALREALARDTSFSLQLRLRPVEGQPERWVACAARWRETAAAPDAAGGAGGAGENGYWICLLHDLHEHRAALARVGDAAHHDAHHDPLTGLPNRRAFSEQLGRAMSGEGAQGRSLALLFIDLDHFQRITDSLGHLAGDGVLKAVADRIRGVVAGDALLARFGGDEFMLMLAGNPPREAVEHTARRLLAAIEPPLEVAGRPISVTASIGVALFPQDADSPAELIRHADTAMYLAKARGRATWQFFEPALATSAYAALVMEGELAQALQRDELTLHFQPQVRASDGVLVGAEALVRWRHPERGLLPPDEFIPLAEQRRLMLPLGAWVLREAARTARAWQVSGLGGGALTVAVNLSMRQFQAEGFVEGVATVLRESGLPAALLELELTERMLMEDREEALARLVALKALGVRLSVDDFGTGHSSLGHLKDLPIDKMKIDRAFVTDLPGQADSVAIARAILQMGRSLGITVVAEGVETEAQRRFLAGEQCDGLQGEFVSPPLAPGAFEAWAARRAASRPAHPGAGTTG